MAELIGTLTARWGIRARARLGGPQPKLGQRRKRGDAGLLFLGRLVLQKTSAIRQNLLQRFDECLSEKRTSLASLLLEEPANAESVADWLSIYGRELYDAGRPYSHFSETINAISAAQPVHPPCRHADGCAPCSLSHLPTAGLDRGSRTFCLELGRAVEDRGGNLPPDLSCLSRRMCWGPSPTSRLRSWNQRPASGRPVTRLPRSSPKIWYKRQSLLFRIGLQHVGCGFPLLRHFGAVLTRSKLGWGYLAGLE